MAVCAVWCDIYLCLQWGVTKAVCAVGRDIYLCLQWGVVHDDAEEPGSRELHATAAVHTDGAQDPHPLPQTRRPHQCR